MSRLPARIRRVAPLLLFLSALLPVRVSIAFQAGSITGRVVDAESGVALSGVHVYLDGLEGGTVTILDGTFALPQVERGRHVLHARYLGYTPHADTLVVGPSAVAVVIRLKPSPLEMDVVVVSASRERQARSDVPMSVTALGRRTIEDTRPGHPSEIMSRVPGVWVNTTTGEGHMTSIRQPLTTDPVYLYLEDGVPIRSTGFFNHNALYEVDIPNAGVVEVIRGPGNALYGSDAVGGVVNVISRPAPPETGASVSVEGGRFGYRRVLASAGTAVGRARIRADVNASGSDGWRDAMDYSRIAGKVRWDQRLGGRLHVTTTAGFATVDSEPAGASALSESDFRQTPNLNYTPISYRDVTAFRLTSAWEWESNDIRVGVTPYMRYNAMEMMPNWSLSYDPTIQETSNWSAGTQLMVRRNFDRMDSRLVAGSDFEVSPGGRFEYAIVPTRESGIFTEWTRGEVVYDYSVTFRQAAPYAQIDFTPVEGLRVSAGGRFDLLAYDYETALPASDTGRHRRPASTTRTYRRFSPKIGATYSIAEGTNLFASWRHAFRAPSESQLFRQGSTQNTVDLAPVRAENVEIGLRTAPMRAVGVEIVAYSLEKTNDIVPFTNPDGTQTSINAGSTLHRGLEVGISIAPVDVLDLSTTLTYATHRFERWELSETITFTDRDMDVAPRLLASAVLTVRPLPDRESSVALEWNRVGSYWMDPANTVEYGGHSLLSVRGRFAVTDDIALIARVTNLTDRSFAERATYNAFRGAEYAPGAPRSYTFGISADL